MKKFVVDENCIACDACTIEAPGFFSMNEDEGCAFVSTQPRTNLKKKFVMKPWKLARLRQLASQRANQ